MSEETAVQRATIPVSVLVVEDEESTRRLCAEVAESCGMKALVAGTVEEALRRLETSAVDIVVTDLILPPSSGLELLKQVHEMHPQIAVLVLTQYGSIDSAGSRAFSVASACVNGRGANSVPPRCIAAPRKFCKTARRLAGSFQPASLLLGLRPARCLESARSLMNEAPVRQRASDIFPELLEGLRLLEGRFPSNELAIRVVRAAISQSGVAGARLWRTDRGEPEVWAEAGTLATPPTPGAKAGLPSDSSKDPALWVGALGSDDFRVRVLEVRGDGPLSEAVRAQMDFLGRFAAVVLALAERRGAMKELSSIIEATKKLNSTLDLGELISIILQIATRQTGAERGTVFLVDREHNEIWSLVGLGLEQQVIRLPADRGIAGWVAREGVAVRLENAYNDSRFEPDIDRKLGFKTLQLLCLPIRNEAGAIIGVLQLLNKSEGFTDEDEAFLDTLSAHVALALEKAQLHRERVEKEKMERDLALAREIQAGFLPDAPPVFPGIEICVSHRPSQMVGGDYYDFLPVREGGRESLLLVVADVEGKGAASALVMANVQAILHALADCVECLEKLPATINQKVLMGAKGALKQGRATKYLSMFLAMIEPGGRRFRYVNAGHVPPAVIRADGSIEWLETGGMIVGLLPDIEFECASVALDKGDLLVACTDGITEAMDSAGTEFSRARLVEIVTRMRQRRPDEIMQAVIGEVEKHSRGGVYEDDRILMVMKAD